jgi:predicted aspartyl protease
MLSLGRTLAVTGFAASAFAVPCHIVQSHPASEAEQAYLHGDYDRAVTLYRQQLQEKANDPALVADLVQVLLKQQKVKEADDLVQQAGVQNAKSAVLLTALGDIQYREGTPWLAAATVDAAIKLDPCYARAHLLNSRLLSLSSFYATEAKELSVAHALDPHDPTIHSAWLQTLPLSQRITELEAQLANGTGGDPDDVKHTRLYLERLKKQANEPHKACRLVSDTATTSLDFAPLMYDAKRIRTYGLDVKLNDQHARLEIDTGASGLLITRSVAERSGLKHFADVPIAGIGSGKEQSAYMAYADDIKIGSLEFKDCDVRVVDKINTFNTDGLIGMNVFSRFLVTLDYPMRKLLLGPLPKRPDEQTPSTPTLETANSSADEDDAASHPDKTPAPASAPKTASGPRDRYIAPEMKDWTRVYRYGHDLMLPASLNGSKQKLFIMDTGAFTTTISPQVAREVTKVRANDYMTVTGLSGKVEKVYTADDIKFAFANISQKTENAVAFDTSSLSKSIGLEISGLIGITTLGHLTITIDYRDGLVKFDYAEHRGYASPFQY